jgi:hypothetical protein
MRNLIETAPYCPEKSEFARVLFPAHNNNYAGSVTAVAMTTTIMRKRSIICSPSMMFVPAYAFDVVPGCRLMVSSKNHVVWRLRFSKVPSS